jgi:lysozyme family protein
MTALTRQNTVSALVIFAAIAVNGAEPDQEARWNAAKINPKSSIALDVNLSLYQKLALRYQKITDMRKNGVPAPVIFCLHQRESSGSFLCHPHEGSPLTHRTRYVPKGRLPNAEPPYTFEQSAEDAYYVCDRLDTKDWCHTASRLQAIESFNGLGYQKFHPDVPSPYLWSGTSVYTRGKYTGDGKFDHNAIDKQLGVAAILKRMEERGIPVFCSTN